MAINRPTWWKDLQHVNFNSEYNVTKTWTMKLLAYPNTSCYFCNHRNKQISPDAIRKLWVVIVLTAFSLKIWLEISHNHWHHLSQSAEAWESSSIMGSLSNTSLIQWRCWWIGCRNIGGHFLEFILLTQAAESLCYGLFQDHKVCWWNQVANHRLFQLTVGLVPANCANFPCVHMASRLSQKVMTHSNSWHTNFRKLRRPFHLHVAGDICLKFLV
jgi:hypothetical protein